MGDKAPESQRYFGAQIHGFLIHHFLKVEMALLVVLGRGRELGERRGAGEAHGEGCSHVRREKYHGFDP